MKILFTKANMRIKQVIMLSLLFVFSTHCTILMAEVGDNFTQGNFKFTVLSEKGETMPIDIVPPKI